MVKIEKCVKMAMAMKGIKSMKQFSYDSGIEYGSLLSWTKEGRSPGLVNLERLAKGFNMKVSEFLELGEDNNVKGHE